ncbi:hypothetical protein CHUAL_009900 [Chamberlinius hualienensis]
MNTRMIFGVLIGIVCAVYVADAAPKHNVVEVEDLDERDDPSFSSIVDSATSMSLTNLLKRLNNWANVFDNLATSARPPLKDVITGIAQFLRGETTLTQFLTGVWPGRRQLASLVDRID